jgi:Domain of unknown function (DUF4166)
MWLGPNGFAYESAESGSSRFHVQISHRFTGLIIGYRGWLEPAMQHGLAVTTDDAVTQRLV